MGNRGQEVLEGLGLEECNSSHNIENHEQLYRATEKSYNRMELPMTGVEEGGQWPKEALHQP